MSSDPPTGWSIASRLARRRAPVSVLEQQSHAEASSARHGTSEMVTLAAYD